MFKHSLTVSKNKEELFKFDTDGKFQTGWNKGNKKKRKLLEFSKNHLFGSFLIMTGL